jgi:hypothetical protein
MIRTHNTRNQSKYSIVKHSLIDTYNFLKRLRDEHGPVAELIIVPFDGEARIYSTIDLQMKDDNSMLARAIPFSEMKKVIEDKLIPNGGTDFWSVNDMNSKIDACISSNNNVSVIKYIMSDGHHCELAGGGFTRRDLLNLPPHTYDYAMGIGSGRQYDGELLQQMAVNFVDGNDNSAVENAIIGDTFACTNIIAKDVSVSIISKAAEINSCFSVVGREVFQLASGFDPIMASDVNLNARVVCKDGNSSFKLTGGQLQNIARIDKTFVFIFYVDKSGSMNDIIEDYSDTAVPSFGGQLMSNDSLEALSSINSDDTIDDIDIIKSYTPKVVRREREDKLPDNTYYKHRLETIPIMNISTEIMVTVPTDEEIFFEISFVKDGKQMVHYCKCNYVDDIEDVDILNKCCILRRQLDAFEQVRRDDRVPFIKNLNEIVNTPEYNKIVIDQTNMSLTKMFFLNLVEIIKKISSRATCRSDILLNDMMNAFTLNSTLSSGIQRTITSSQCRMYTSGMSATLDIQSSNTKQNDDTCIICNDGKRSMIYDCNHCVACRRCTKRMFFGIDEEQELARLPSQLMLSSQDGAEQDLHKKECPYCRKTIKHVTELSLFDPDKGIKCNAENCANNGYYISLNCMHLTYCRRCIQIHDHCPCNIKIGRVRRVIF